MENEIWTFIPTTNGFYQISHLGRVRKICRHIKRYGIHIYGNSIYEVVEPKVITRNYLELVHKVPAVSITLHGLKFPKMPISELMFLAFHGIANIHANEIIHLDGDEENNELSNLMLTKPVFKLQYLAFVDEDPTLRNLSKQLLRNQFLYLNRISKYNENGELTRVFSNCKEVEKEEGISRLDLLNSMNARSISPINNFYYKRGHGPQLLDFSLVGKGTLKPANFRAKKNGTFILQYSKHGGLMAIYTSLNDASNTSLCSKENILTSIKSRQLITNYLWVQLDDVSDDTKLDRMRLEEVVGF
jgi:hypothetical protein